MLAGNLTVTEPLIQRCRLERRRGSELVFASAEAAAPQSSAVVAPVPEPGTFVLLSMRWNPCRGGCLAEEEREFVPEY